MMFIDGESETYGVRVGEGTTETSQVLRVKVIPVLHIPLLDLLFLHLGQRGLLVHAARKLIGPLSLCPIHATSSEVKKLINSSQQCQYNDNFTGKALTFSCA